MTTPVVLVTGLSGAGKAPALRMLEDLVARDARPVALGIDIRTRGFDAAEVLNLVDRLRANPALSVTLVFVSADRAVLLRRFTETRRRHPMSHGRVEDGIAAEVRLTRPLLGAADVTIDTSELPLPDLRRLVTERFTLAGQFTPQALRLTLLSFAFPAGLPRDADMVFDVRFIRNPHYDPILRAHTGLNPDVAAFVEADPDYERFFAQVTGLLELVLPRFVGEGKKYATVAVGCSGGRHRSVRTVERLAPVLRRLAEAHGAPAWTVTVLHRELTKGPPPAMGITTEPGGMALPGFAAGKV